jgi:predicted Zn-dependent protease with MMP-like domain
VNATEEPRGDAPVDPPTRRRRDRHGRGMRGPLAPVQVPIARSRAQLFDDLVLDAVEHLEPRWSAQLEQVQFAVEDVPPPPALGRGTGPGPTVPLGAAFAATATSPPQVVVYRRPIEARSADSEELADLVHDVVVEEVAELLGLDPDVVDPGYGDGWDDEG